MNPNMRVTTLALKLSRLPTPEELRRAFKAECPDEPELTLGPAAPDGSGLALELPNMGFLITLVGAPIPWPELEPLPRCAALA